MATPVRVRPLEIPGRINRTYRVRDVAEVDAALRALAMWFFDQVVKPRTVTLAMIENLRHDQDKLLDARFEFARKGLR